MSSDVPAGYHPLVSYGGFITTNGPLYLYHQGNDVRMGFRVEPRHCNMMGICHGGMMATFCDMLLPLTVHRVSPEVGQRFLPTVNLQIDYLAATHLGSWVEGKAEVLRVTRSLVFAQGMVTADGTPVARVSAIFKVGGPFTLPQGDLA